MNRTACKRILRHTFARNTCKWLLRSVFVLYGLCVKSSLSLKLLKYKFLFLAAETACIVPSARVNTGQTNDSHSVSLKKYDQIALFIVLSISEQSNVYLGLEVNNTGVSISVVKLMALYEFDLSLSSSCVVGRRSKYVSQLLSHCYRLIQSLLHDVQM